MGANRKFSYNLLIHVIIVQAHTIIAPLAPRIMVAEGDAGTALSAAPVGALDVKVVTETGRDIEPRPSQYENELEMAAAMPSLINELSSNRLKSLARDRRLNSKGALTVHVKSASGLRAADSNGTSDPFAVVRVKGVAAKRTRVKPRTCDPVWNQSVVVMGTLANFVETPLRIEVYDRDHLSRNDYLGTVSLPIDGLAETSKLRFEAEPLAALRSQSRRDISKKVQGTLTCTVSFQLKSISFALPSPIASSGKEAIEAEAPPDATAVERARDATLRFVGVHWVFTVLTVVFIAGVAVWVLVLLVLFPLQMGIVPWDALGFTEEQAKWWWVVTNQCLTGLFTYQNSLAIPWRLSVAAHLCSSTRSSEPGCDFYGRPTQAVFFHLPRRSRGITMTFLLAAIALHVASQILRGFYNTWDSSERGTGQILILITFVPSILCGLVGGAYQARELYRLHKANPERFPPSGAQVMIHSLRRRWRQGEKLTTIVRGSIIEAKKAHRVSLKLSAMRQSTQRRLSGVPGLRSETIEVSADNIPLDDDVERLEASAASPPHLKYVR